MFAKRSLLLFISLFICLVNMDAQSLFKTSGTPENIAKLPIDSLSGKVNYNGVVKAQGISKSGLYEKAKQWIAMKSTDNNPYSIKMDEKEKGRIITNGNFLLPSTDKNKYVVSFQLNILLKEGKFKYEMTDFVVLYSTETKEKRSGLALGGVAKGSETTEEAQTYEYSIETFYPSRVTSTKPYIKYYDGIKAESFNYFDRETKGVIGSLKSEMLRDDDW